jgi:hypothetical protein
MSSKTPNSKRDNFGVVLACLASVSVCYALLSFHGYYADPVIVTRHSLPPHTIWIPGWWFRALVSLLGVAIVPVVLAGWRLVGARLETEVNRWRKLADNTQEIRDEMHDVHEWTKPKEQTETKP